MILSTLGKDVWDITRVPKKRVIEVKQDTKRGEVGVDMFLIPVRTKNSDKFLSHALGGKRIF